MEKLVNMFNDIYRNKRVLITGETGFKGSWLALWLHELGADVYGFSKGLPTGPCLFNLLDLRNKIKTRTGNINQLNDLIDTVNEIKPDFVFHLAAQAIVSESYANPVENFQTNVMGTINVLESIRLCDHPIAGVFVTSDKCYHNDEMDEPFKEDDPLGGKDPYSASKGAAEVVIRSYYHSFFQESRSVIGSGRAGNVIGGGDWAANRIVPDCVRSWSNNEQVVLRRPDAIRPWQHVLEPLSGYLTLGSKLKQSPDLNGQSFNFGPNPKIKHSVGDLVKSMATHWGQKSGTDTLFRVENEGILKESQYLRLDSQKAMNLLDWETAFNLEETIATTTNWYKDFYINKLDAYDLCKRDIDFYSKKSLSQ
ncbi:MAG: CDP-glucose 4,6-dehydratase [Bacteroidota bacterium]